MNMHVKRIWVIFSVALNIGFIITAVALFYFHPSQGHHHHHIARAREAVSRLDLQPDQEKAILSKMDRFSQKRDASIRNFHHARTRMLSLLSQPGPLDQQQFEAINQEIKTLMTQKHESIRRHILDMRKRLGDEKGATFFATILAQVEAEQESP